MGSFYTREYTKKYQQKLATGTLEAPNMKCPWLADLSAQVQLLYVKP